MRSGDPDANNLFSRLFRYVPQEGEKRKREPIEDFCTEALAYLLESSVSFCRCFASTVLRFRDAEVVSRAAVETQYYAGIAEEGQRATDSRIDLLFRPTQAGDPIIGVESKIRAPLGSKQLQRYRKALEKEGETTGSTPKLFFLVPHGYRKDWQEVARSKGFSVKHWEDVQAMLTEFAARHSSAPATEHKLSGEFARFLASNGLEQLKITMNPNKMSSIRDAAKLIGEWSRCLDKLRVVLGFRRRLDRTHCRWESADSKNDSSFYGSYDSDGHPYAGFEINHKSGKVHCYYEDGVYGAFPQRLCQRIKKQKPRLRYLSLPPEVEPGKYIWFTFREEYPRSQGDVSDKVLKIFGVMKEGAEAFKKKLKKELAAAKRRH